MPSFHGYRHTAASEAIAAGEGIEEVSWQLGHRDSNVTRAVYVQEIKDAERVARSRARMEARYAPILQAAQQHGEQSADQGGVVVSLEQARLASGPGRHRGGAAIHAAMPSSVARMLRAAGSPCR